MRYDKMPQTFPSIKLGSIKLYKLKLSFKLASLILVDLPIALPIMCILSHLHLFVNTYFNFFEGASSCAHHSTPFIWLHSNPPIIF